MGRLIQIKVRGTLERDVPTRNPTVADSNANKGRSNSSKISIMVITTPNHITQNVEYGFQGAHVHRRLVCRYGME
jgi:hypothetical protein